MSLGLGEGHSQVFLLHGMTEKKGRHCKEGLLGNYAK